jgi:hypothetical protein
MAAADWPVDLPQAPLHAGYAQREQTATLRSPMGYGPAKVRRRTQAAIQPVNASLVLTAAQRDSLLNFYGSILEGGTLRFNWSDPLTDAGSGANDLEFRFTAPIQWSSRGPDLYLAVLNLEVLP